MHRLPIRRPVRALSALVLSAAFAVPAVARAADWPVFGHDPARSGVAAGDTSVTPANVATLRRAWVASFDEVADSTPILLSHVRMPRGGVRALLFQTTRHGTTYAVDAHSGAIVWRFATPGPTILSITPGDANSKITTSTPVADPSGRYVYVPSTNGYVHKLDAATGAEVRAAGFPLRITLMPDVEKDASALNLANGYLYAVTSGYIGDQGPYDGHVVTVRLKDGATHVYNSLCANIHQLVLDSSYNKDSLSSCPHRESGIWARGGAVVDPDPSMGGRVYVATGNGTFDANRGGANYGDSVLALSPDGARLLDSFTPSNYDSLEQTDLDIGSTAPVMLPRETRSRTPLMAVQGGKDNPIRLLNRAHLGGVHGELQELTAPGAVLFSAPAAWRDGSGQTWVYIGDGSGTTALRLVTDAHGVSRLVVAWSVGGFATSPVVSNGMVFVSGDGGVKALDARTGRMLWTSANGAAGGTIGSIHWESPIVVNGFVYISDEAGHLTAYTVSRR